MLTRLFQMTSRLKNQIQEQNQQKSEAHFSYEASPEKTDI